MEAHTSIKLTRRIVEGLNQVRYIGLAIFFAHEEISPHVIDVGSEEMQEDMYPFSIPRLLRRRVDVQGAVQHERFQRSPAVRGIVRRQRGVGL